MVSRTRLAAAFLAVLAMAAVAPPLAGCGPRATPQRPCGESVAARATGDYMGHGGGGYDVHASQCRLSCEGGDEDACVEYQVLALEQYWPSRFTLEGAAAVQAACDRGRTSACDYLALPRVVELLAQRRWEATPYRGERGLASSPIASAAGTATREASAQGLALLADATYSLVGTSDLSFDVTVPRGGEEYVILLVAERAMTFEAELRAPSATISLDRADLEVDVTARSVRVTWTRAELTNRVAIHATGSERGDVRYLLFGPAPAP